MEEILRSTPERISSESIFYNIPIYQRLFEWDEERIRQLLDDLYDAYKSCPTEPYYIGMLTAKLVDGACDLVDGQQRFTVSTLLGIVLQNYYTEWKKFLLIGKEPRLKFSARDEDKIFLLNIINSGTESDGYVNERMADGLKVIGKWMSLKSSEKNFLHDFSKYVYEQMSFFITRLPEDYRSKDLNRYFEAMNSLGRNLESYEILEVDCLRILDESCDKEMFERVWNAVSDMDRLLIRKKSNKEDEQTYHQRFTNAISSAIETNDLQTIHPVLETLNDFSTKHQSKTTGIIGEVEADSQKPSIYTHEGSYHSMLTFSEFLLEVLYIHLGLPEKISANEFFDVHKLSETFSKYIKQWDSTECVLFLTELLRYRLIYDFYFIRVANLESEDYDLEICDDNKDDKLILKKFQTLLYAGSASKTFYRWVAPTMEFINTKKSVTAASMYKFIVELSGEIYPDVKDVEGIALRYDSNVDFYWFRALDFILWKEIVINHNNLGIANIKPDIVDSIKFRRGRRSIEHLHPQNESQNDQWQIIDNKSNVHRFGNLALISCSFNSEQSNDNLNVKFARIKQQIGARQIQSVKLYLMYLAANGDGANWNEENMIEHETKMIDILHIGFL